MRIHSIDSFRALTMLLMIWVNDFWSLSDVPRWLEHMPANEDALGFSDVIFPVFLFIVGLSIPFAIRHRRQKGDTETTIFRHIVERSFALLVMGFFMVNLEYANDSTLLLPKTVWQILMIVAFGLIWNLYPPAEGHRARLFRALKIAGWAILILLAATYRSSPVDDPGWMEPHWWGILGLIGWAYLLGALVYLWLGSQLLWLNVAWLFFALFNVAAFAGWLAPLNGLKNYLWIAGDGSMPALAMAGVVASAFYLSLPEGVRFQRFALYVAAGGVALLLLGFALRPFWGISKILATPAWTQICSGIGLLGFATLYWLIDVRKCSAWTRAIAPAGTATLTCYLVPYLAYPAIAGIAALGVSLPAVLTTGVLGLVKSMAFAFGVVWFTALLVRLGIKLKI